MELAGGRMGLDASPPLPQRGGRSVDSSMELEQKRGPCAEMRYTPPKHVPVPEQLPISTGATSDQGGMNRRRKLRLGFVAESKRGSMPLLAGEGRKQVRARLFGMLLPGWKCVRSRDSGFISRPASGWLFILCRIAIRMVRVSPGPCSASSKGKDGRDDPGVYPECH